VSGTGSRMRILMGVLVLLLLTVLWWLFLLSPKRDAIDVAEAELDNSVLREQSLRTRLAQLQEIKDNELSYLFAIGQMESSIPATPQADAFIEDITFLAESTGVALTDITLAPPVADEGTGGFEVSVAIAVEGEYFEILGFLYGVEALDRLVRVDGIQLTPMDTEDEPESSLPPESQDGDGVEPDAPTRPNPDLLSADISLRIFTRSPAAGTNTPPATVPQGSAEIDDGAGENI